MSKLMKSVLSALLMIMLGGILVNASEHVVLTQENPNATVEVDPMSRLILTFFKLHFLG